MEGSHSLDIVPLIVWLVILGVECFCLQELFEGLRCLYIHQSEHSFPIFIESEDGDPHNARDPIIKAQDVRHRLFFGATYAITFFNDSFFCVSNICSDSLRTFSI